MSLVKCKECGKEISNTAKFCPHCGAKLKKKGIGCFAVFLIAVGIFGAILIIGSLSSDGSKSSTSRTSTSISREQKLRNELQYLNDIKEISWFEVDDNDVYIGFRTRPNDLSLILRGAALRANKAINFGVHVWGVKSSQKGWRPGQGPYYEEVTARYGKIE